MINLTPPQAPPTWTHTADQVTTMINECIAKDKEFWNEIRSLSPEDCTFESVRLFQYATRTITQRSLNPIRSSLSHLQNNLRTGAICLFHLHPISMQYPSPKPRWKL